MLFCQKSPNSPPLVYHFEFPSTVYECLFPQGLINRFQMFLLLPIYQVRKPDYSLIFIFLIMSKFEYLLTELRTICIPFCDLSVNIFSTFFNKVLVYFFSKFKNYIQNIIPFSVIEMANIFSQFAICPFTLLMLPFLYI